MTAKPGTASSLIAPFPAEQINRLPRLTCKDCRNSSFKRCDKHTWVNGCPECKGSHSSAAIHLDYVGHADVTRRLLEVDPEWTWEPVANDPDGMPAFDTNGGLWIRLTIGGVTRLGYGDAAGKSGPNAVKECIGDAIRNAAMRFGVALDLWSKADRHPEPEKEPPTAPTVEVALERLSAVTDPEQLDPFAERAKALHDRGAWSEDDLASFQRGIDSARLRLTEQVPA